MDGRAKPITQGTAEQGAKVDGPKGKGRESRQKRKSRPSAAHAAKKELASKPATQLCPECGKAFRTDEAVQTHRHAAHGTAATVVGDMTRCPECGSLVKNSHMAKHRRREHGLL